ncbi:hypothetical protein HPP92_019061 [Vanilla planifolia]|uniref:Uncharacterized protein n=1 Tax=Vanilla planifolia TaxID=51239 RepID=A0A835Q8T7_VANPL|nr:hypothetical protein HPP92_019583 [Vanilla planifolia]KAG0464897.1 hypothetical protein HPP92_019061 [Vanilla planifolia]
MTDPTTEDLSGLTKSITSSSGALRPSSSSPSYLNSLAVSSFCSSVRWGDRMRWELTGGRRDGRIQKCWLALGGDLGEDIDAV